MLEFRVDRIASDARLRMSKQSLKVFYYIFIIKFQLITNYNRTCVQYKIVLNSLYVSIVLLYNLLYNNTIIYNK